MSLIVAARFDTFEAAEYAATLLFDQGFPSDTVHIFFVNPAGEHARYPVGGDRMADPASEGGEYGAVAGGAVVGIVGALIGVLIAFSLTDKLLPIIGGAGVGAYLGSLAGALYMLGRIKRKNGSSEPEPAVGHASGVTLAVQVQPESEKRVARILKDAGGIEVERAQGQWTDGRWVDFNPLATPELEKDF